MRVALLALITVSVLFMTGAQPSAPRRAALVSYGAQATQLEPTVRAAAKRLTSVALRDAQTTKAELGAASELGTVCGAASTECLVQLAVLMNVDLLVVASATNEADGATLELVAIDSALGREVGREKARIPSGPAAASERVQDQVELLLEPHLHFGVLTVTTDQPGTLLTIDGVSRAESLDARVLVRVRAGPHRIEVTRPGFVPFVTDVDVRAGAELLISAKVVPSAAGAIVTSPTVPPTTAGLPVSLVVAGATSGTGLLVAVVGGAVAFGIDAGLANGLGTGAEKSGYQQVGLAGLVATGVGGIAAIGGGVALLFLADDEGAKPEVAR